MNVYRISCEVGDCEMKGKTRFSREEAEQIAAAHIASTEHHVSVVAVGDPDEKIVVGD